VAASKKEVDVVVHEDPCKDKAVAFADVLAEAIEESDLVLVVFEDGRSHGPADHDVMQGTGGAQAGHKLFDRFSVIRNYSLRHYSWR
jgi:hypothetical protein